VPPGRRVGSYALRRAASLGRPVVDLRYLFASPVRQQGLRPLCVPFSLAAAHEATRTQIGAPGNEMLAVEPIWQHCLASGHASHGGTTLAAGQSALHQKGQTAEQYWPYNPNLGAGTEPEPRTTVGASWYTAESIPLALAHDGIEELVEDFLAVGLPVVLVIEITSQFERADTDGEIALPPLTAPAGDYHAVLAVGAATHEAHDVRRLLVRNTWGNGWAAGGYGWLPLDYLIAFAVQAAAVDPTTLAASPGSAGAVV
jgi:Papain family cysteine protease